MRHLIITLLGKYNLKTSWIKSQYPWFFMVKLGILNYLKELHWLPIEWRIEFKLLCITYKSLNGQAPQYLSDLLQIYTPSRALRSSEQGLLCVPKIHTKKLGTRAFAYAAPLYYNALPLDVCRSTSLDMFKSRLKTHFFRQSYSE